MADDSDRYSLVYNGEVYNYIELRRELEQQGQRFRTQSDTEVLLQCLMSQGTAALSKLDGMFAFALWDRQQRQLLLARDRVGDQAPLFIFATARI